MVGAIVFVVVGFIVAALFAVKAQTQRTKLELIRQTPTTRIRDVRPGLREVQGKAANADLLTSPLTNQPCVFYRFVVEEEREHTTWDSSRRERRTHRDWHT